MRDPDVVLREVSGADPIAGNSALEELVALGDEGEERLFSRPIGYPRTIQATRRLLRYVATRRSTIVPRLFARMDDQTAYGDAHASALLFAGAGPDAANNDLYELLERGYDDAAGGARFMAWGFAGGSASALLQLVEKGSYAWEKLGTFAFRGGCVSAARSNEEDWSALEALVTQEWKDGKLVEITSDPDTRVSSPRAIDASELWGEAIHTFLMWRRGALADRILRDAPGHEHWRVRDFGAQVVAGLGFRRTVAPVVAWLRKEPLARVRLSLLNALERSETIHGADAALDYFVESGEGGAYVARSAWRSGNHARAREALTKLAHGTNIAAAEALVSLARMGARHENVLEAAESTDHYLRVNAALALAYLQDERASSRIAAMQEAAARPLERIYLAAARALLGQAEAVQALHEELMAAAEAEWPKQVDFFEVHRFLQAAVLDAFANGGASAASLRSAWEAECAPVDPIAKAVDAPAPVRRSAPSRPHTADDRVTAPEAVDLLLVTVNEHETRALIDAFAQATGQEAVPLSIEDRVYRDLGSIRGARCMHALSEMGTAGPGAAFQTVDKGIRALSPKAVIFVGIAFGVDKKKQAIGDILLARQLRLYDMQRVGADIIPRGDKVHSSTWLVNFFNGFAQTKWDGAAVRPGLMLSADKLVDNIDYREQIRRLEPEAIGGEMEGAGLYVASQDAKVDWIVIKAICDWADGHKSKNIKERQRTAAHNAAEFLLGALQHTPLVAAKTGMPARKP